MDKIGRMVFGLMKCPLILCALLWVQAQAYWPYSTLDSLNLRYDRNGGCRLLMSSSTESTEKKFTSAAVSLIKKGKMKLVQSLLKEIEELGESHPTQKFLLRKEHPFGVIKPIDFHNTIMQNKGTVAILPEFNKKSKTGFIIGIPPPEILGGVLRDAGAKSIIVSLDSRSGGATVEEFERFCKEQAKARIFLPGPISIIWHDIIVHPIQIAHAAAHGGSAITLWPEMTDDLKGFVEYANSLGIEPIVMIKSQEEGELALGCGARFLCIHSLEETATLTLKNSISASPLYDASSTSFLARLRPEEDFSVYHEIDMCWNYRDEGFVGIWPSPEAIYGTGMRDVYANINAMRAKASRIFLSPRQFLMDRNKEGAREYLGDILY